METCKIDSRRFYAFLQSITAEGKEVVQEAKLSFGEGGLICKTLGMASIGMVEVKMPESMFEEYVPIGDMYLAPLNVLTQIVKQFNPNSTIKGAKVISLSYDSDLQAFIVDDGKLRVNFPLYEEVDERPLPEFPADDVYEEIIVISGETFKKFMEQTRIGANDELTFRTEPGKLIISSEGRFKFDYTIDDETIKGGTSVKFGHTVLNSVGDYKGDTVIHLKTDFPIKLYAKYDDPKMKDFVMERTIFIAPRKERD